MTITVLLTVATLALCFLYLSVIAIRAYRKYSGTRLVTCPETDRPVAVAVDATHAAVTATIDSTDLRLKRCTRWPERADCGQECLRQIEAAPEDCLVRNILAEWYAGKSCALCGAPIPPLHAWEHRPGLIDATGKAVLCTDVPAEQLPELLTTHQPICWNCDVAEEFRRRNPELVIEAPARTVH